MSVCLEDYSFDLPEKLIASRPLSKRTDSRLLKLSRKTGVIEDTHFSQLLSILKPHDLLVFNNTRVMKARLYGNKVTGGRIEILIERILDDCHAKVMLKSNRPLRLPCELNLQDNQIIVESKEEQFYHIRSLGKPFFHLMAEYGEMPLPPYMARKADDDDLERYQTVYASHMGAVAAPTAGLHFDELLLSRLQQNDVKQAFVTLHVGAGTFLPIKSSSIDEHTMHSEKFEVKADVWTKIKQTKELGGRVIAVGTTSMRALESAARINHNHQDYRGDTQIFIKPPFDFKLCDGLITNFHLPQSTLLMLVSAFVGHSAMMKAYAHAIADEYRFYSYGDSMIII